MIAPDSVAVRMYRGLLGDCLLLILKGKGADGKAASSHILIDCGVLQGTAGAREKMTAVVEDIYTTVKRNGAETLDLVVVTHEHHDHICGFAMAADQFAAKRFSRLWMAWTENPEDKLASELQARFGHAFETMALLADGLDIPNSADGSEATMLGLAGFSGAFAVAGETSERGSRAIYRNLKQWAGAGNIVYLEPGNVVDTPGAVALKAYVLGPPRDEAMLFKALPSRGSAVETYFAEPGTEAARKAEKLSPFAPRYRWRNDKRIMDARAADSPETWVRQRYFDDARPSARSDFDIEATQRHRQLSDMARLELSTLALKMDNKTNNSSLVLAFELPDKAGILLFAADAQVGNWLSWENVVFRKTRNDAPLPITSDDLLRATRLYKVGHHGSHNATLRSKGLELMNHPDLVAMIPTDAEFAKQQSKGWLMPNPRVEQRLIEKTRGRVLRGDRAAKEAIADHREQAGAEAAAAFKRRITQTPLYVEYRVFDRAGKDF